MFSGVGRSPRSHHVRQLLGSCSEEMCNHSGADSAALNRSHTRCLVVPFRFVLYAMSSFFSAEVDGMTGTFSRGRKCMSAVLKHVQQGRRTSRSICFYEGFLVPVILLNGNRWLYGVLSFWVVFHLLSYISPICFHSVVSCRVYTATRLLLCVFPIFQGQVQWPRRVSCHGSTPKFWTRRQKTRGLFQDADNHWGCWDRGIQLRSVSVISRGLWERIYCGIGPMPVQDDSMDEY